MYETTYGSKYNKDLNIKAIAALVRADIKAAVKDGALPAAKYSVRLERFSGGRALDVTVSGLPFELLNEERALADHDAPRAFSRINLHSVGAMSVERQLERIMAAYNFDGSDIQSDYFHVNFYAHIRFDADESAERKAILARNGRAA